MTTDAAPTTLGTWTIDPYHNFAQFTVKHMMIATVTGRLGPISGTLQFDPNDLTTGSVEAIIDVTALSTGVDMRDNDLRSANFFDVEHYPTITFRGTRVEHVEDDQYRVHGDLTIHGVTRPVTLTNAPSVLSPTWPLGTSRGASATARCASAAPAWMCQPLRR